VKTGVVFPQTEIGAEAVGVKAFAQAAEDLGYQHLLAYDHVIGASTKNRPDFAGPYRSESMFHSRSRRLKWTDSATAGYALASESVGIRSNTKASTKTSTSAANAPRSKLR